MFYEDKPSNRRYIEQQLYSKKLELANGQHEFQIETAIFRERNKLLQNNVDSLKAQLDLDDDRNKKIKTNQFSPVESEVKK
jgi:hypothetical protein